MKWIRLYESSFFSKVELQCNKTGSRLTRGRWSWQDTRPKVEDLEAKAVDRLVADFLQKDASSFKTDHQQPRQRGESSLKPLSPRMRYFPEGSGDPRPSGRRASMSFYADQLLRLQARTPIVLEVDESKGRRRGRGAGGGGRGGGGRGGELIEGGRGMGGGAAVGTKGRELSHGGMAGGTEGREAVKEGPENGGEMQAVTIDREVAAAGAAGNGEGGGGGGGGDGSGGGGGKGETSPELLASRNVSFSQSVNLNRDNDYGGMGGQVTPNSEYEEPLASNPVSASSWRSTERDADRERDPDEKANVDASRDAIVDSNTDAKADAKADSKADSKADMKAKAAAKPDAKTDTAAEKRIEETAGLLGERLYAVDGTDFEADNRDDVENDGEVGAGDGGGDVSGEDRRGESGGGGDNGSDYGDTGQRSITVSVID